MCIDRTVVAVLTVLEHVDLFWFSFGLDMQEAWHKVSDGEVPRRAHSETIVCAIGGLVRGYLRVDRAVQNLNERLSNGLIAGRNIDGVLASDDGSNVT